MIYRVILRKYILHGMIKPMDSWRIYEQMKKV